VSRVAVLGTGLTGGPIATRLAAHGDDVVVWNRTRAKAEALGLPAAGTPAEAVEGAEVVVLCLLGDAATDGVLGDSVSALDDDALVIDLATTSVEATRRLAGAVPRPVKAPFFGSVPEVERGALFFVVGCGDGDWVPAQGALAPLGETFHVGDPEAAAALKLALNLLVFTMVENIAETLALARAQGVDPQLALEVLSRGTGVRSPIYLARGRLMLARDFAPRATIELARHDLALIAAAARERGLRLPMTEAARDVFERAGAAGLDDKDLAAVASLL
jgi:3-hydroxyisobutyrate dehydrogenase